MIIRLAEHRIVKGLVKAPAKASRWIAPGFIRQPVFRFAFAACAVATAYYGFVASDRYVSESRVIIQRTDLAGRQASDLGAMLSGTTGTNKSEQLLLRDHLLSVDMLTKLDEKLNLRAHYSDSSRDPLSRMWFLDASLEDFYDHYRSRVEIEYDDYAGVLSIKSQGYDPKTSHAITSLLVEEGEKKMNDMAHQLAKEQVSFVEKKVAEMADRFQEARRAMLVFQNKKGLVSPQSTAETLATVINRLESQRSELQARRTALLGYLAPTASGVVEIDLQIKAIEQQIGKEQARLTSSNGNPLNSTVEEYQRLEMAALFAQDAYKTALVAYEKGQVEATRTINKVSVLQKPTLPQSAAAPARLYNIIVFILVTFMLAGIVYLILAIVRDHKD